MAINNFNVGVGTTSQLTRYRYVATGGETSVSGTDADGKTLSYTVGLEQVFLNGVNLVRGQDYTATNGTSVGALTALVASDVVEVFAYVPFNIANALTVSTVDAKGDLLVGTGADAVGRLAVGTNNQLLAADSSTGSGLKWANGGLTLISTTSFSGVGSHFVTAFSATYTDYLINLNLTGASTGMTLYLRLANSGTANTGGYYYLGSTSVNASLANFAGDAQAQWVISETSSIAPTNGIHTIQLQRPFDAVRTGITYRSHNYTGSANKSYQASGYHDQTTSYAQFAIVASTGNITGEVSVYGYNK